tara:strand:- start:40188 stop:40589 length:402 start_codon:yes stop_codon:yes gene_type:complete
VPIERRLAILFLPGEIRSTCRELTKLKLDHPDSEFLKRASIAMVKKSPQRVTAANGIYEDRTLALFVLIDAILDLASALRSKSNSDAVVRGLLDIDALNLVSLAAACARYLHSNKLISAEEFRRISKGIQSEL